MFCCVLQTCLTEILISGNERKSEDPLHSEEIKTFSSDNTVN